MPAAITHYLQVERVINGLKKLHPNFEYNRDAVLCGAQGPDFILCHRALPGQKGDSIKKYGAYLQDENINNLQRMIFNTIKNDTSKNLINSYIIGFLSHSILDRLAYPFISFSAESLNKIYKDKSLKICRNNVKSTIDVIILRYEKQQLPTELRLKTLVPQNEKVFTFMQTFFTNLINDNYNANVKNEDILEAITDFRKFLGLMTDRTGKKKDFFKKIEKWTGKDEYMSSFIRDMTEDDSYDYSNLSHKIWNWPLDSEINRTESFFDIYEKSIVDSISTLDKLIIK